MNGLRLLNLPRVLKENDQKGRLRERVRSNPHGKPYFVKCFEVLEGLTPLFLLRKHDHCHHRKLDNEHSIGYPIEPHLPLVRLQVLPPLQRILDAPECRSQHRKVEQQKDYFGDLHCHI